jgi:hypothetical protein
MPTPGRMTPAPARMTPVAGETRRRRLGVATTSPLSATTTSPLSATNMPAVNKNLF